MQILPYKRPTNPLHPINNHVDDEGRIILQSQQVPCPICDEWTHWQRECQEHYQNDDGEWIPMRWSSWHAECTGCDSELVDPYEDGLIHVHDLLPVGEGVLPDVETGA